MLLEMIQLKFVRVLVTQEESHIDVPGGIRFLHQSEADSAFQARYRRIVRAPENGQGAGADQRLRLLGNELQRCDEVGLRLFVPALPQMFVGGLEAAPGASID